MDDKQESGCTPPVLTLQELIEAWRCPYCEHRAADAEQGEERLWAIAMKAQAAMRERCEKAKALGGFTDAWDRHVWAAGVEAQRTAIRALEVD